MNNQSTANDVWYDLTNEKLASAANPRMKPMSQIATERYRDLLANVTKPYAAQMAARPLDPIPLTASEQWLINDARHTAEDAQIIKDQYGYDSITISIPKDNLIQTTIIKTYEHK
jgi:hypothetical protein